MNHTSSGTKKSQAWRLLCIIKILKKLRQENCCEFKAGLGYITSKSIQATEWDPSSEIQKEGEKEKEKETNSKESHRPATRKMSSGLWEISVVNMALRHNLCDTQKYIRSSYLSGIRDGNGNLTSFLIHGTSETMLSRLWTSQKKNYTCWDCPFPQKIVKCQYKIWFTYKSILKS